MDVVYGRSLEKKVPAFCNVGVRLHVEMWYPDTWISGYLDIQAILAIHYPDTKFFEISKYPNIQVSMISKYPCIQVSGYIKN